jgi:hypothetical protein
MAIDPVRSVSMHVEGAGLHQSLEVLRYEEGYIMCDGK